MLSPSLRAQDPPADGQDPQKPMVFEGTVGGWRVIEEGMPPVLIHATLDDMLRFREANPNAEHATINTTSTTRELHYHGGIGGIGVETSPRVYLVLWGSQWNNDDPSGEAALLESFYRGVGGSSWADSVTQYCQGVLSGTVFCTSGTHAGNPTGIFGGVWADNTIASPSAPTQSQFATEAVRAAKHFGHLTALSNASVQYVIATATHHNSSGFGTQYCAYHTATSSTVGNVAYTNLPYITDAGASCGANFHGLGSKAGITIVAGHEMAETMTDQFPAGGWIDSNGEENGDKCAWISSGQGAAADIHLTTGTFPVQSLWSNKFNSDAGGCVISYP